MPVGAPALPAVAWRWQRVSHLGPRHLPPACRQQGWEKAKVSAGGWGEPKSESFGKDLNSSKSL